MLSIFLLPTENEIKSTLPGIFLGIAIGIILAILFGWGFAAILGRRFVFKIGILLLIGILGFFGAIVGDAIAAEKRPLNEQELEFAQKAFGTSLNYSRIKLALNSRLMSWPKRGMNRTPFNTIYLSKRYSKPNDFFYSHYEDLLVHELTHAWQTQHGISFFKKAFTAFGVIFNRKKPYDYGSKDGLIAALKQKKGFRNFTTEQQGKIMEHYFCCKYHKHLRSGKWDCAAWEIMANQLRENEGRFREGDDQGF